MRVLREKLIERGKLIFQLDRSKFVANCGLELTVTARSPAIVEGKDRETLSRQNLVERVGWAVSDAEARERAGRGSWSS